MNDTFQASIEQAVHNPTLNAALTRFSESYRISRAKAYEGIDFEALRTRIAERKGDAAGRLGDLAAQFQVRAEELGVKVYFASSPQAVKDYVLKVAEENGAKRIVKSKSMASEEVHLNAFLKDNGIDVCETDLGEWIIQLAGQRPSHMVMPAIHLTKEEVSDIFSKEVDERLSTDIPRLVAVARRELREKFLAADIGISGANIAVADTGSIVIMTNEGNARLVTTLPKTHIAIVGLEKLVETFDDVEPILTALPRSATGQLLTSYVSILTGPADGKDLHIILMDNHRTAMGADPIFAQALQCIRCASCLNVCPVYRAVGGHVFGKVYTGGIGTILTAWFDELSKSDDIQSLCIQCGTCNEYCPGKIDIAGLIFELRKRLTEERGIPATQRAAFSIINHRRLFHSLLRTASVAQKPMQNGSFIRHLPLFMAGLTEKRSLPAIAAKPLRDTLAKIKQPKCQEKAAFYAGCLIDFVYPELGESVIKVLNRGGVEVSFPDEQTCCGAPARYSGAIESAAESAKANIDALLSVDAKYIVSACPTCTVALKHDFSETLRATGATDYLPRAAQLAEKVIDFSTLVEKLVDEGRLHFKPGMVDGKVTYHDSCHLKRTLHASAAPRAVLSAAGRDVVEMAESDICGQDARRFGVDAGP
jgi:iron-sulfur cluster protein